MMPKEEESKQKSQKLDHITEIIGIFGPFHGFWYTVLGETYYFFLDLLPTIINGPLMTV